MPYIWIAVRTKTPKAAASARSKRAHRWAIARWTIPATRAAPASISPPARSRACGRTPIATPTASSMTRRPGSAAASRRPRKRGSGSRDPDSLFCERARERPRVLAVARLDQELDFGAAHGSGTEDALMLDFDDVAARSEERRVGKE